MTDDIDAPRFKIAEAAARVGVAEGALRAWLARSPSHRLGTKIGKALQFSKRELYALAITAACIKYGAGPPSAAFDAAKRIAAMPARPDVFVRRDRRGIEIDTEVTHRPAIAIPAGAIWASVAEI